MVAVFSPTRHFSVGDGYCNDVMIEKLERCEGIGKGMLQDRVGAIARFGTAVKEIEKVIAAYPDFSITETDCKNLPGQFGEKCYEGSFLRPTSDINFIGIYVADEKILVIETENIVLTSSQEGPVFLPEDRLVLGNFVDVKRFSKDMNAP